MKIALFTEVFLPKIDGVVTRLPYTVAELQRQGDQVLVFAPGEGVAEYCGARVVGIPGNYFPLYPETKVAFPRASIRQHMLDFAPDVIHEADAVVVGRLLDDPAKAQAIRLNARRQAEEWNWTAATRELKAVYQKAINTTRRQRPPSQSFFEQVIKRTAIGGLNLFLS